MTTHILQVLVVLLAISLLLVFYFGDFDSYEEEDLKNCTVSVRFPQWEYYDCFMEELEECVKIDIRYEEYPEQLTVVVESPDSFEFSILEDLAEEFKGHIYKEFKVSS